MTQDHSQPDEQDQSADGIAIAVGKQLSAAREASGQNMASIAQQLCINTSKIRLLESGQWESAGPDVYVRGYLMGYGRLLELDVAEVVHYFRQRETERVANNSEDAARQQKRPEFGRYQRVAGYAAATLLIGPALIFWVAQGFKGTTPAAGTEVVSQTAPATQPAIQELQQQASKLTRVVGEQPVMASMGTVPSSPSAEQDTDNQTEVTVDTSSNQVAGLLQLDFKEEVWLEVSDSSGKRLDYGLVPANSQRSFSIAQGLSVRLGNADSVTARIDGKTLDLQPYIDQDVASFSLPLTQSDTPQSKPVQD